LYIATTEIQPGLFHCVFHNTTHSDIIAKQSLVLFYFSSYVSSAVNSTVSLSGGDTFFDPRKHSGCSLSVLALDKSTDTVIIHSEDSCGDKTLRQFLTTGNIDLRIISIKPNPASNEITIETLSSSLQEVSAIIYDDLGREYLNEKRNLQGKMALTFPTASLSAGTYHFMLKSASGSVSSGFIKLQ
jgi:hypothetical protein